MNKVELTGKFARLRAELVHAQAARGDPDKLARLIDELSETRRLIVEQIDQPSDEQTGDSQFFL